MLPVNWCREYVIWFEPVSYTHLNARNLEDLESWTKSIWQKMMRFLYCMPHWIIGAESIFQDITGSVSYTHLDVYKRQVHIFACEKFASVDTCKARNEYDTECKDHIVFAGTQQRDKYPVSYTHLAWRTSYPGQQLR